MIGIPAPVHQWYGHYVIFRSWMGVCVIWWYKIKRYFYHSTFFHIVRPITHIINMSFNTSIVPDPLKIAKVVPIYKASDKSLRNNYRPICLLPIFSKLIEQIMFDKVMNFLNKNNIIHQHQYGFRAKHSTLQPIVHFLNHCAMPTIRNKSDFNLAIFCDLSKAFDVISHEIIPRNNNIMDYVEQYLLIMKIPSPVYWTYCVVCLKVPCLGH